MGQVNPMEAFNSGCANSRRSAGLWTEWRARHLRNMPRQSESDADVTVTSTAPQTPLQEWPRVFPGL